jgi:hypothetical protein
MSSIFQQLGYNYSPSAGEIIDFDQKVLDSMNNMPDLLSPWQYEDMRNEDTAISNYLSNPVVTISTSTRNTCISIESACAGVNNLATIASTANTAHISANNFILHTNRISGLEPINSDTTLLPHYDTAISTGKVLMYLVYQSDGVQNNAPIMGSFTSLFIKDDLTVKYNTISGYPTLIANSISANTYLDGGGNTVTELVSNLTNTQISTIITNISALGNTMTTRRTHDENFYINSGSILEEYNELKKFKAPGSSETNIINDYIGTTRLKNNLTNTA